MLGVNFVKTCETCPEQYDIVTVAHKVGFKFIPERKIGYVRLRYGELKVYSPDENGKCIYKHTFDDKLKGCFSDDKERRIYLMHIAALIFHKTVR